MKLSKAGKKLDRRLRSGALGNAQAMPITVISGFLGSGKTTFLNHLLQADHGLKIAVMVNDFGSINIDSELVLQQTDTVISLSNGCVCCSVQNDLIGALENVLAGAIGSNIDHVLVEASGVSDPAKIAHITRYPNFKERLSLNMVLSLVDVELYKGLDQEARYLALLQIEAADIILINKTDLSERQDILDFKEDWLYKEARILEVSFGKLDWKLIFESEIDARTHDLEARDLPDAEHIFETTHLNLDMPISLSAFKKCIRALPTSLLRAKGFLYTKEYPSIPILFQLVGRRIEFQKLKGWDDVLKQQTRLVLIGQKGEADFKAIKKDIEDAVYDDVL